MVYGFFKEMFEKRFFLFLKEFRMEKRLKWFFVYFFKGMKQKVMIMCVFFVEFLFYIIDELFFGFDLFVINVLLEWMDVVKKVGLIVLMLMYILVMVECYCDVFIILYNGEVWVSGILEELREQFGMRDVVFDDLYIELIKEDVGYE